MKNHTLQNTIAQLQLAADNGGLVSLAAEEAQAVLDNLHSLAEASSVSEDLIIAAGHVIDTYNADYDVQEVGGDPLEAAMIELSDALIAARAEPKST